MALYTSDGVPVADVRDLGIEHRSFHDGLIAIMQGKADDLIAGEDRIFFDFVNAIQSPDGTFRIGAYLTRYFLRCQVELNFKRFIGRRDVCPPLYFNGQGTRLFPLISQDTVDTFGPMLQKVDHYKAMVTNLTENPDLHAIASLTVDGDEEVVFNFPTGIVLSYDLIRRQYVSENLKKGFKA